MELKATTIKQYTIILSEEELLALHLTLGATSYHQRKQFMSAERADLAGDMYFKLTDLIAKS